MQPFQYFQIVNLVDCLSSWYKFIMKQAHGDEFANFIVSLLITDYIYILQSLYRIHAV